MEIPGFQLTVTQTNRSDQTPEAEVWIGVRVSEELLKKQWAGLNLYYVLFVDAVEDELAAQGGRSDGVRPRHHQEIRQLWKAKQHREARDQNQQPNVLSK